MDKLLTQLGIAKEDKDLRKEIALYLLREVAQSGILKQEMVDDQGAARGQIGQFYTVQVSKPVAGNANAAMPASRSNAVWHNFGVDGTTDDRKHCGGHTSDKDHEDETRPNGKYRGDDEANVDDVEDPSDDDDLAMGGSGSDDDDVENLDSDADDMDHDVDTENANDYGELVTDDNRDIMTDDNGELIINEYRDYLDSDYGVLASGECSDDDTGSQYDPEREPEPQNPLDDEDFMRDDDDDDDDYGVPVGRYWQTRY